MRKSFKYRIYPSKSQTTILKQALETCRCLYNNNLACRKESYEKEKKNISYIGSTNLLKSQKEINPYLMKVHSQVLQEVLKRVDSAYMGFFRRVKSKKGKVGFPRFKGRGRYDSFTFPQSGWKLIEEKNLVRLSKIGSVKIRFHRPIEGIIKTCTVIKSSTNKWYVCFNCDVGEKLTVPINLKKSVGIDLGIKVFATMSDKTKIANPRFFKEFAERIAVAQQKLSNLEKGSNEREKQKKIISHIYEKLTNKRRDFAHKESLKLVKKYNTICLEKLNTTSMLENSVKDKPKVVFKNLHKAIVDVAWKRFINYVMYKAEYAGTNVVIVNPKNTSKMCSRCGRIVDKDLSVRTHNCSFCNLKIDRDLNASINILRLGTQSLKA